MRYLNIELTDTVESMPWLSNLFGPCPEALHFSHSVILDALQVGKSSDVFIRQEAWDMWLEWASCLPGFRPEYFRIGDIADMDAFSQDITVEELMV